MQSRHWIIRSNRHLHPTFLQVHGPIEVVAFQGGPCAKMLTLDQGCVCKWTNYNRTTSGPVLRNWQYVEKGTQFGTDSLLLHLDPFTLKPRTVQNCIWTESFQTITFCEYHWLLFSWMLYVCVCTLVSPCVSASVSTCVYVCVVMSKKDQSTHMSSW